MTETDAAWLAGFLDGEGSFMVTRSTRRDCTATVYEACISAANTDRRLVERCKELCGGKIASTKAKSSRWKDAYVWQLKGPAVDVVVRAVMPYLAAKGEQAILLQRLRAITRRGSPPGRFGTRKTSAEVAVREEIWSQVKALNQRGRAEVHA